MGRLGMSYRIKHKFVSITACILSSVCSVAIRKYVHPIFFFFFYPFFWPCFGDFRIRVRAIVLNAWGFESDFLFFSFFLPCFADLRARVSVTVCNDLRLYGDFLLFLYEYSGLFVWFPWKEKQAVYEVEVNIMFLESINLFIT